MWRRTACLVAIALAHAAALTGYGQDRPLVPLPDKCPSVRFELVMGRLTAIHLNAGQFRLHREPTPDCELRETLLVNSEGPIPVVRYECHTPSEQIVVEFTNGTQVTFTRSRLDGEPGLTFQQDAHGPLTVHHSTVRGDSRVIKAPTFWHLLLAEPRLCEYEIAPVLQLLRSDWDLSDTAEKVEKALFRTAHAGPTISRTQLAALVRELGHSKFQRRQAADHQLRELGPTVLPYLSSLQPSLLSREQRHRIRQIQIAMASAAVDSPDRVAHWLVDDEQIWVVLMNHSDAEKRHLAALRLAEIHPAAVNFDPYGDELYRQRQLDELRLVLRRK